MASRVAQSDRQRSSGNLRIGDQWNAINIMGIPPDQLLERLLELTLYTEENLR
jgi:hypothetical protein